MRFLRAIHDLSLCLILGGIAGTALCALILFDRAPSREVAGQIGSAIFDALGPAVLVLSLTAIGTHFLLLGGGRGGGSRAATVILIGLTAVALLIGLWLTPRMVSIWNGSPHASDGSGLVGDARGEFFMLHGLTNLGYLAMAIAAAVLVVLRSRDR